MQRFLIEIAKDTYDFGYKHLQSIVLTLVAYSCWRLFWSSLERVGASMSSAISNAPDPITGFILGGLFAFGPVVIFFLAVIFSAFRAFKSFLKELATDR